MAKYRTDYLVSLLKTYFCKTTFTKPNRFNRRPAEGWVCPGNAQWSRAVRDAGLPIANFWSGSNPTPSSQYPVEIRDFLEKLYE